MQLDHDIPINTYNDQSKSIKNLNIILTNGLYNMTRLSKALKEGIELNKSFRKLINWRTTQEKLTHATFFT